MKKVSMLLAVLLMTVVALQGVALAVEMKKDAVAKVVEDAALLEDEAAVVAEEGAEVVEAAADEAAVEAPVVLPSKEKLAY